ncbi:hypothetical protein ABIE27_004058 [Paenibacillus sp. 4624]|uniref:hypothetical protein n=1 Tax=Paenibacillus sp. 4624 TaxID=3156453 RepID=UPI003D1FDDAD
MFFFFFEIKRGTVCRVISGRDEGKLVVAHQVHFEMLWCYENKPVKYRINRKGEQVIEFDPACVTMPYSPDELEVTNEIPLQDGGWGLTYRRSRMWL